MSGLDPRIGDEDQNELLWSRLDPLIGDNQNDDLDNRQNKLNFYSSGLYTSIVGKLENET